MSQSIFACRRAGIDADDVGALCLLHALADRGEVEIAAVVHGTGLKEGVGAISALNEYYARKTRGRSHYEGTARRLRIAFM